MNALVSTIPARTVGRDHAAPTLLDILRGFFTRARSHMMAQARAAVHTHVPSMAAVGSFTPDIDKIWGHTVKRARQGSPLHRQTLALLDRADRLAIEAACGSWRS
jgi:hypothetical protein